MFSPEGYDSNCKAAFLLIVAVIVVALFFAAAPRAHASAALLYLEAQGVGAYSSAHDEWQWYSQHQEDVMQKPSLGFDYLQKLSGETGDFATIAVQARAAYDDTMEYYTELQLYNAYILFKSSFLDLWMGHNKPAMGLSTYLDTHGHILPSLSMYGYGFDRDWGFGVIRQFEWGDLQVSATTGSGMPAYARGNYLLAGRISFGVLAQDNYTVGATAAYGRPMDTMGYHFMDKDLHEMALGGIDAAYTWDYFDIKAEAFAGKRMDETVIALFARFSANLMEEGRLKLEIQPLYFRTGKENNYEIATAISFLITGDITLRGMYRYSHDDNDHRAIFQVYYYLRIL